MLLKIKYKKA